MEMEMEQEMEWIEAQKIGISVELVAVAKRQLQFLAAVDRNRYLYQGPVLHRAIYRYNACWLPLLAKHSEKLVFEGPLVVPLDCEWIWHCHRLNPVRYKSDCEQFYGRILDNSNVISSVQGRCTRKTEEIWNSLYPEEPYTLNLKRALSEDISDRISGLENCTKYDLVSAVKRQSPFFYQMSRPHMNNDLFLEGAVARYRGFLHLIKRNIEKSLKRFCVPTYDIDLIWHSHQLNPVSYGKDLNELLGKILEHDDTDSDRTKGMKLDVGFSGTTKQWEDTFGTRYWRAGAMFRGNSPTPITDIPLSPNMISKEEVVSDKYLEKIQLPEVKFVEVLLEFVGVRNLPDGHKGSLFVSFSKSQPDVFFDTKRKLTILSESKEKQVASFQCEPTGELLFELISHSPSNLPLTRTSKTLGASSLSLKDLLVPVSKLSLERWLDLVPCSGNVNSKPIGLHVAVSLTVPAPAQSILHMVHSRPVSKSSCFFPLPGKTKDPNSRMHVIDESGTKLIILQIRTSEWAKVNENSSPRKEVIGIMESGEICTLAEFTGAGWSLMNSHWSLRSCKNFSGDHHHHIFELVGNKMVKFFPGRKLDYEPKHCEKHSTEQDFLTAVEFSAEDPYGKAVALLNLKSLSVKIKEGWMLVPSLVLAFISSDMLKKERYDGFVVNPKNLEINIAENINGIQKEGNINNLTPSAASEAELNTDVAKEDAMMPGSKSSHGGCGGGCGSGCGGGCGKIVKSGGCGGGCGSGCGGGCGVKSGGCGGCGGGCGGCGGGSGGCGGGSGNIVKSGGCGGCGGGCGGCGGGCGNIVKSGGCGGCGGGGGCGGCGGCGGGYKFAQSDDKSCADAHSKETPAVPMNEAVAA